MALGIRGLNPLFDYQQSGGASEGSPTALLNFIY